MKSKKWFFEALRIFLNFYDGYKEGLDLSHDEAVKRTLEAYDDFWDWLQEPEKEANHHD
jgi:hypothetical protein